MKLGLHLCITLVQLSMLFNIVIIMMMMITDDDDHGPFVKPGVMIEEEEVEVDTKWTDLPLLKHGSLTALEIEEHRDGGWIQRIRAR